MPPLPFRGAILATVLALIAPEEAEDRRRRLTRQVEPYQFKSASAPLSSGEAAEV